MPSTSTTNGTTKGSSSRVSDSPQAVDSTATKRSRKDSIDIPVQGEEDDDEPEGNRSKQAKKIKSKGAGGAGSAAATTAASEVDDGPRTSRACLACRKLKTKCEEAEEAPCKRCRLGGYECIFVESKRGKRPTRKPTDANLAEKFRNVEKTLSVLLQSMSTGAAPDPSALAQLQASLAEGIAADSASSAAKAKINNAGRDMQSPLSSGSDQPRLATGVGVVAGPSSSVDSPFLEARAHLTSLSPSGSTIPPSSTRLSHIPLEPAPGSTSSTTGPSSLAMLADASLAAQIDGRSVIKGLDHSFSLSRVTEALEEKDGGAGEGHEMTTPPILAKGIISPEQAVEMFKLYYEWIFIHLPGLDPNTDTATSVCARSPFLFTVICAVASRHSPDPNLHVLCYEEAHACFLDIITTGKRTIENVQACLIMTVWGSAPKTSEDRPARASLYFGMAVRMALELGLFRPPAWVDAHLAMDGNATKPNPWVNISKSVSEEEQREALMRERTWVLVFVIDRNISAVMGRPYQVHEAKPLLMPMHPLSLPFDLGLLAHSELQVINGQVMDTFRDRIYGLSSASDEMPSQVVMKIFNSRMDEWKQRWCPMPGEPIANILLFYFYSSKLFLNTIPLHTMLRRGDVSDDPECVSTCLCSAKSLLDLAHEYATLGVLAHCPDVNFLLMLYGAVFLVKVKASNTRFAELVDAAELQSLLVQAIQDCRQATSAENHAAATSAKLLRAVLASWRGMMQASTTAAHSRAGSLQGAEQSAGDHLGAGGMPANGLGLHGTLAGFALPSGPPTPSGGVPPYPFLHSPFSASRQAGNAGGGYFNASHGAAPPSLSGLSDGGGLMGGPAAASMDNFLHETNFFSNVLVSQGENGFFSWADGLDSAGGLDFDFGALETSLGMGAGGNGVEVPFSAP